MYEKIMENLENLTNSMTINLELLEEIFNALKENNSASLQELVEKQNKTLIEIPRSRRKLGNLVEKLAKENGVDEARIQMLFPYVNQKQKENIIDKIKFINKQEKEFEIKAMTNDELIKRKMSEIELLVEIGVEESEKAGQVFFDRNF